MSVDNSNNGNGKNGNVNGNSSRAHIITSGVSIVALASIAAIFTTPIQDKIEANETQFTREIQEVKASFRDYIQGDTTRHANLSNKLSEKKEKDNIAFIELRERINSIESQGTDDRFREIDFEREIKSRDDKLEQLKKDQELIEQEIKTLNKEQIVCCVGK
tara:strand:- start:121 stop:603 length:483 start_codon:yes stop_codon:yes gene_type:complete